MVIPNLPPIPCPDCKGMMYLQRKPSHYVRHHTHPFWYKCQEKDCWGNVWAHPDGQPMGTPANRECRLLRKRAHELIDAVWRLPGNSPRQAKIEREIVYKFMAHKLKIDPHHVHLSRITDPFMLKRFVEIAEKMTRPGVFSWWYDIGRKHYSLDAYIAAAYIEDRPTVE